MPMGISPKGMHKKTRFKGDMHTASGSVGKAGSPSGGGGRGSMMSSKRGGRKRGGKRY